MDDDDFFNQYPPYLDHLSFDSLNPYPQEVISPLWDENSLKQINSNKEPTFPALEVENVRISENNVDSSPISQEAQFQEPISQSSINSFQEIGNKRITMDEHKEKKKSAETKNIPKNYGKEIIKFVKKNKPLVSRMLREKNFQFTYHQINFFLQSKKNEMSRISDLKKLWTNEKYGVPIRILSEYFLRKRSLPWIFNSRIENKYAPLKYKIKIREGVQNPLKFNNLSFD